MEFIISASTDVGIEKMVNQDSLSVKVMNTMQGKMVFAILCDGMGGLSRGEVASASVVTAFNHWVRERLPEICVAPIDNEIIRSQWMKIVCEQNCAINDFGMKNGISIGTTAVVMLLTQTHYFILNVGDSRAYEINGGLRQLTNDQTFVAREVSRGRMTWEEAKIDSRRNILLQCIGASCDVYPDFFYGNVKQGAVYMLCSDGFCHEITEDEIYMGFLPESLCSYGDMEERTFMLIERVKNRLERDNISVVLVRTF